MPYLPRALVASSMLLAFAACRGADEPTSTESFHTQGSQLTEGTPHAVGVLAFLNDGATTEALLDDDVRLDRRAAEGLIAFRAGDDAQLGTSDDANFATIAEVDAVKWVGPSALQRIHAYAETHGWVPVGDDVLGIYDDVTFTVTQAETTLALVNSATHEDLDVTIGLDRRAADGIVAIRPFGSVLQLSKAYYVGTQALLSLRDYAAPTPSGLDNGEECDAGSECLSGLCVGETIGWGMCDEAWMADDFTWDEADEIPDGQSNITLNMNVQGLATVPVDVVVTLDIDHPNKEDLVVTLYQPGGGVEVLWDHEANPPSVLTENWGIERDNMVNGTWTLEIVDTVSGNLGEFRGANLYLSSRYD